MSDFSSDFDAHRVGWWQRRSAVRKLKRTPGLTVADRDLRIQRARAAHIRGELNSLTRDLGSVDAVSPQSPAPSYGSAPPAPQPLPAPQATRRRSVRSPVLIGALVLLVTCGGGLVSCVSAIVGSVKEVTSQSASSSDLLASDGWDTMIGDLDQGIDIRAVVEVVARSEAATIQVPDGGDTVLTYLYDGDINLADDTPRNPARVEFDLTLVDGEAVASAVDRARDGAGVDQTAEAWVRLSATSPGDPTIVVTFPSAGRYSLEVGLDGSIVSEVR